MQFTRKINPNNDIVVAVIIIITDVFVCGWGAGVGGGVRRVSSGSSYCNTRGSIVEISAAAGPEAVAADGEMRTEQKKAAIALRNVDEEETEKEEHTHSHKATQSHSNSCTLTHWLPRGRHRK